MDYVYNVRSVNIQYARSGRHNKKWRVDKLEIKATGVLLAGGKNSRMGRHKAFLELDGRLFIDKSLEVLQRVFSEVLISSNEPSLFSKYDVQVIRDEIIDKGPIGGLYSSMRRANYDKLFFVACDMPFLSSELIRTLYQRTSCADIVVPDFRGLHPLHAFYSQKCIPYIEKNIKEGLFKILDFYHYCTVNVVSEQALSRFGNLDRIFCNINTPEDLRRLQWLK